MSIESIKARVDAATGGKWLEGFEPDHLGGGAAVLTDGRVHALTNIVARPTTFRDREFIAHARQDIPALLAVAEAAAYLIKWLEAAYPPASPVDELRDALTALEILP